MKRREERWSPTCREAPEQGPGRRLIGGMCLALYASNDSLLRPHTRPCCGKPSVMS